MDVESELEKERELILGGGEVIVGRSGGWLYIPLCTLFSKALNRYPKIDLIR